MAEGVRLLEESLRHKFLPATVYYTPALLSERGKGLVEGLSRARVPTEAISARQMGTMADTQSTQGILGIFPLPSMDLAELYRPRYRRVLLGESLSDPGNLGTLARSALAFGFEMMLLVGPCVESYSPKVVRASAGAIFGLKIARVQLSELFDFARAGRFKLIATARQGKSDIRRLKSLVVSHRLIVAVGSEVDGLSSEIIEHCDLLWRIKHSDAVESLNAAVAGSIIMKQIFDIR